MVVKALRLAPEGFIVPPNSPPSLYSSNTSLHLQLIQSYRIKRGPRSLRSSLNAIRRCNTLRRKFGVRRLKISLRDDAV